MTASENNFFYISELLTGLNQRLLQQSGVGLLFFDYTQKVIGKDRLHRLMDKVLLADKEEGKQFEHTLKSYVLVDPELGPIAINIIKLWYIGSWQQMPKVWRDCYGQSPLDMTKILALEDYLKPMLAQQMNEILQ